MQKRLNKMGLCLVALALFFPTAASEARPYRCTWESYGCEHEILVMEAGGDSIHSINCGDGWAVMSSGNGAIGACPNMQSW